MKVTLRLKEALFNCGVQISDSRGVQQYQLSVPTDDSNVQSYVTVDMYDSEFDLLLIPIVVDTKSVLDDFEMKSLKDKFSKKTTEFLFTAMEKSMLRVSCKYRISGINDGDKLDIDMQVYAFGTFDRFDIFELYPVSYTFFEASQNGRRFDLIETLSLNRKFFIKNAKKIQAVGFIGGSFLFNIITYPFQITRIRWLTRKNKISEVLLKFNKMNDSQREKLIKKFERL